MLKHPVMTALVTAAVLLVMSGFPSPAMALEEFFSAKLRGGNETPLTLSTAGSGIFAAQLDASETFLTFVLAYDGLTGVTAAHIHLGQPAITGGIVIHFCGTGGKPACPASPAQLFGVVTALDVVAVTTQGIAAGAFADVIRAIRKGDAYVNVHTSAFPGGEIRGPLQ